MVTDIQVSLALMNIYMLTQLQLFICYIIIIIIIYVFILIQWLKTDNISKSYYSKICLYHSLSVTLHIVLYF